MYRALVFLAACGFHGAALGGDGGSLPGDDGHPQPTIDAPAHVDIDAQVVPTIDAAPPCALVPSTTHTIAGHLGGTGGGQTAPAIACAGAGVPVGLQLFMTQSTLSNHNNQTAVTSITVQCGVLTPTTTTLTEKVNRVGSGGSNCSQFNAPIDIGMHTCPAGTAITAIDGNEVDSTLYNTIVMTCSDGSQVAFANSGAYTNQPQHVACAAGSVVVGFDVREACGQDTLQLECAPLTCE